MDYKIWYASKTIWFNILLAMAIFLVKLFGVEVPFDKDELSTIATVFAIIGNISLRSVTKEPVRRRKRAKID
jgi:uncharacterized membrane protein